MALTSFDRHVLADIREHGWMVTAVSDLGCDAPGCQGDHSPQGLDPYLFTAGLTEAGLPELLLRLPGRNTREWIETGRRLLDNVVRHTRHRELIVGETLGTGIARITITVTRPEDVHRRAGGVWPGQAYRLYGSLRVRLLEIVPSW